MLLIERPRKGMTYLNVFRTDNCTTMAWTMFIYDGSLIRNLIELHPIAHPCLLQKTYSISHSLIWTEPVQFDIRRTESVLKSFNFF